MRRLLSIVLLATACSVRTAATLPGRVSAEIPPAVLAPRVLDRRETVSQNLRITRDTTSQFLTLSTQLSPEKVRMVGMKPLAAPAFNLLLDGRSLNLQSAAGFRPLVDPRRVLLDLQMAVWPKHEVEKFLGDGWSVHDVSEPCCSRVIADSEPRLEASFENEDPLQGRLMIRNSLLSYTLEFSGVRLDEPLPDKDG